jgi:hypothetical protein
VAPEPHRLELPTTLRGSTRTFARLSASPILRRTIAGDLLSLGPPEQREQALAAIRDLLGDEHELALEYRTEFQWARLQSR